MSLRRHLPAVGCADGGRARVARRSHTIGVLAAAALVAIGATTAGASTPSAPPAGGIVLTAPFPQYDGTLTPYTFELAYPLVTLVYDTLFWRDATGTPQPWLARSLTTSDGGRLVTVVLRSGVRWQDGKPLTAADVAFTFGYVAGHFHPRFTPEVADIQRVTATGPETVTFRLRHVSLGFEDQPLSDVPILPKHLWQKLAPGQLAPPGLPVGSGPYRLVKEGRATGYVFEANEHYFLGQPTVREIRVPIVREEQQAYNELIQGAVDLLPFSLPGSETPQAAGGPGVAVQTGSLYSGTELELNLRRAPFSDPQARRAVAAALDLPAIADAVGPAASAQDGYIDPQSPWSSGTPLQQYDPAAARAAFTRLRLPPLQILAADDDPVQLAVGRQVVTDLNRAGAQAVLQSVSSAALARALGETGSRPSFEAAIDTTPQLASYDPDFLAAVFGSNPRSAPLNVTGYRSSRFDALARQVASAPDVGARRAATRAELRLLAADVPAIPIMFEQGTFAYRPAAYSAWVFIKGAGIVDKRSFLSGPVARGAAPREVSPPAGSSSGSGPSVVDVISIVVVAIVLLAALAVVQARRTAGRR